MLMAKVVEVEILTYSRPIKKKKKKLNQLGIKLSKILSNGWSQKNSIEIFQWFVKYKIFNIVKFFT
jgi:hypothetical protein